MEVNYFGPLIVTRAFAPILEKNHGAIVNVLSILARVNAPASGSYSASKAAALSATEGIRAELAPYGVRVIGVMPGYVDTEMVERLSVPKMAASDVVDAALGALRAGVDDVYPGVAASIAELLTTNPAVVHAQFAAALTASP
jgi:NAD(P)-dependent dehydrogenase (short-subunit alcohol dehydrogenase family)